MRYIEEIIKDVRQGKPLNSREEMRVAVSFIQGKYEGANKVNDTSNNNEIIDKIRAEIMDTGAYEQEAHGKTEFLQGINYCLGIIDKYYSAKGENK